MIVSTRVDGLVIAFSMIALSDSSSLLRSTLSISRIAWMFSGVRIISVRAMSVSALSPTTFLPQVPLRISHFVSTFESLYSILPSAPSFAVNAAILLN